MTPAELLNAVAPEMELVRETMEKSLGSDISLLDATNRSILSNSGKRLRPILTLLSAKICSGGHVTGDSISYAAAVELLHNATLLHDDVADDSRSRRGVPTTMSLLGGRASVLLGDYWLVKAISLILDAGTNDGSVTRMFSKTLSSLAEGELLQLQKASSGDTSERDYYRIIYSKTATLFETAVLSGAVSVGASEERKKAIKAYACNLGTAFQIKDDILDYDGGSEIGKPAGQDLQEHKITIPLLGAFASMSPEEEAEIRNLVSNLSGNGVESERIVNTVHSKGGISYAEARLDEFVGKAKSALGVFPESQEKDMLKAIADFTASREK